MLTLVAGSYTVNINDLSLGGANNPCNCHGGIMNVALGVTANITRSRLFLGDSGNGSGGAIYNSGTMTLTETTVGNDNTAR